MKYNDGGIKDPLNIKDKEQAIIEFSEGNKNLEELLRYCFSNNMYTHACCAGHEDHMPFISFYVCKENEIAIKNMINILYDKGYNIEFDNKIDLIPRFSVSIGYNSSKTGDDLFKDILTVIKEEKDVELDGIKKKTMDIIRGIANIDCIYGIQKQTDFVTSTLYFAFNYEEVNMKENELLDYINKKLNANFVTLEDKDLLNYKTLAFSSKLTNKFFRLLHKNNIRVRFLKDFSIIDITGGYAKEEPKLEVVVEDSDSIESVANKLEILKNDGHAAKAIYNGVEIVNTDYEEYIDKRGLTKYRNVFTKEKCISKYNKELLENLNNSLFHQEMKIISNEPLCITFNNPSLTIEDIAYRMMELKRLGIVTWIHYKNIEMINKNVVNLDNTINEIKRNVIYNIHFRIKQILNVANNMKLLEELFNLYYSTLNYTDNAINIERIEKKYYNLIMNYGLDINNIKEEYYKTEHSYDENNQKYSNLIVYRKFKRLLELEIDKTKDSFLIDLYEELKNTDISEIDNIIVKYIRFMNTIDIDEVISDNFRL